MISVMNGPAIPLARDSLQNFSTPIKAPEYCTAQIFRTITSIQHKPDLLSTFDHQRERTKRALFCRNSRVVYLQRAGGGGGGIPLEMARPELAELDQLLIPSLPLIYGWERLPESRHAVSNNIAQRHGIFNWHPTGGTQQYPTCHICLVASQGPLFSHILRQLSMQLRTSYCETGSNAAVCWTLYLILQSHLKRKDSI